MSCPTNCESRPASSPAVPYASNAGWLRYSSVTFVIGVTAGFAGGNTYTRPRASPSPAPGVANRSNG